MANRVKTTAEKIEELTVKIESLTVKKNDIEKQIADAVKKRSILQKEVESEQMKALMALGLSMEELMKLAKEKAEENELKAMEEEEKKGEEKKGNETN